MRALAAAVALLTATPALAEDAPVTASLIGPVLNVVQIDKELDFYTKTFGMKLAMTLDSATRREYMLRFSDDAAKPGIILVTDSAPKAPKKITHGSGFNRLVLRISDLDTLAKRMDAAGFAHTPVREASHGYRMMMLTDPEGYRFELVQSAAQPAR